MKIHKSLAAILLSGILALTSLSLPSFAETSIEGVLPTGGATRVTGSRATDEVVKNATNYGDVAPINAISTGVDGKDGGGSYGYDTLNASGQAVYNKIELGIKSFLSHTDYASRDYTASESISITAGAASENELVTALKAFLLDNPQYYWIKNSYQYESNISVLYLFIAPDYLKATERTNIDGYISATAQAWYNQLKGLSSPYEKALALHDLIIDKVDYAYSSGTTPSNEAWAHNITGILCGKQTNVTSVKTGAVCEGYAETYSFMLNLLGIGNFSIVGNGGGGAHQWNAVMLSNEWYLVDVTWDDLGDKYNYVINGYYDYFCMPTSKFDDKHTPFGTTSPNGNWCYALPTFSDSMDNVYYKKYSSYADSSVTLANAAAFVETALSAAVGDFVYFTSTTGDIMGYIKSQFADSDTYAALVSVYGVFMPANNTQVDVKATGISLSTTTLEANRLTSYSLTATLTPSDSDDKIIWSSSDSSIASVRGVGKNATVIGKRSGTATITATAREGGVSATCAVTVLASAASDFTDEAEETTEENVVWVNGKDIKTPLTLRKTCQIRFIGMYSGGTIATLVTPATEDYDTGAEIAALYDASGKLTMSADLQKEMKNLATAKYAKGITTVTAGKVSGTARVWVFEMKDKKVINDTALGVVPKYYDVSVLMGSSALAVNAEYSEPSSGKVVKSTSDKAAGVAVGDSAYFYINAMGSKFDKTDFYKVSPNETFTVKLKKAEDSSYLDLEYTSGREFKVTGLSLKGGKPTAVTVVATSNMTGKTANFTIGVHAPIYLFDSISNIELRANTTSEIAYSYETLDGGTTTTDSVKAFVSTASTTSAALTLANAKAALNTSTKTSAVTASFKNGKLQVKAAKTAASGTACYVYLCGVGKYGMPVVTSFAVTIK